MKLFVGLVRWREEGGGMGRTECELEYTYDAIHDYTRPPINPFPRNQLSNAALPPPSDSNNPPTVLEIRAHARFSHSTRPHQQPLSCHEHLYAFVWAWMR